MLSELNLGKQNWYRILNIVSVVLIIALLSFVILIINSKRPHQAVPYIEYACLNGSKYSSDKMHRLLADKPSLLNTEQAKRFICKYNISDFALWHKLDERVGSSLPLNYEIEVAYKTAGSWVSAFFWGISIWFVGFVLIMLARYLTAYAILGDEVLIYIKKRLSSIFLKPLF